MTSRILSFYIILTLFMMGCKSGPPGLSPIWVADVGLSTHASKSGGSDLFFLSNEDLVLATSDTVSPNRSDVYLRSFNVVSGTQTYSAAFHDGGHFSIAPINGGDFVTFSDGEVSKYSSSFKKLQMVSLSSTDPDQLRIERTSIYPESNMDVSYSGNSIVVGQPSIDGKLVLQWLRTSDLSQFQTLTVDNVKQFQAGDDNVLLIDPMKSVVASKNETITLCMKCFGSFYVSRDLYLEYDNKHFSLQDAKGAAQVNGGITTSISKFTRAMHGTRIAFGDSAYHGYGFPLKTEFPSAYLDVYWLDWQAKKLLAKIRIEDTPSNLAHAAIALSPTGQYLAILHGNKLQCYKLPYQR